MHPCILYKSVGSQPLTAAAETQHTRKAEHRTYHQIRCSLYELSLRRVVIYMPFVTKLSEGLSNTMNELSAFKP